MKILEMLPQGATAVRYVASQYEGIYDDEDNHIEDECVNEDVRTDVWFDIIHAVNKDKVCRYYRRRTRDLAARNVSDYTYQINNRNNSQDSLDSPNICNVRVKRLGRRVVFVYDTNFTAKMWKLMKQKDELHEARRQAKNKYGKQKQSHKIGKEYLPSSLLMEGELEYERFEREAIEDIFRDRLEDSQG
jgi:hypothetical protein